MKGIKLPRELQIKDFWSKIDIRGSNDCWEWMEYRDKYGYGHYWYEGRPQIASRVALSFHLGRSLQFEEKVLHECDNPPCCNPNHLFIGTNKDNTQDMIAKGRRKIPVCLRGERHPKAKLSEEDIVKIRMLIKSGETNKLVAEMFGVDSSTISCINTGRTWSSVK